MTRILVFVCFSFLCTGLAEANQFWDYLFGKPSLQVEWTYATGEFDESAAEIVAYDQQSGKVFVVNGNDDAIDVLDVATGNKTGSIPVDDLGGPTSVAAFEGLVAIAVDSGTTGVRGNVVFADAASLNRISVVEAGFLPDMLTFTPNGKKVVVANEGEPDDDYVNDPVGSVSIIDVRNPAAPAVSEAGFTAFNGQAAALRAAGVRIFGPGASVAQDLEPEYIAVSSDSRTAFVGLQENNAIAIVDLKRGKVDSIEPLGYKQHAAGPNGMDASNDDGTINIQPWPTLGMYQPDSIAAFSKGRTRFVVTANEGDSRDYDGYSEEERVRDLILDAGAFPDAGNLQMDENLGRLKTTSANGDIDNDGEYEQIYSYGARSFSIWKQTRGGLVQIYDSADEFEQITAALIPVDFNSTDNENDSFDNRSDDKGPEPEALILGRDLFQSYSFIGLERVGGIMLYEISNPWHPRFIEYANNRDFSGDPEAGAAGDLAPEGMAFIPRHVSPFVEPALVVANEVSGTTTLYRIKRVGGVLSGFLNGK